jgi:hypothetical protein
LLSVTLHGMNLARIYGALALAALIVFACINAAYHYWWFLTDPKNSAGLQAIGPLLIGVPTLLFAVIATLAASASAKASEEQANAAKAQTEVAKAQVAAANEQLALAKSQLEDQKLQVAVQRRIDAAREMAALQRLKAEDEATRPRFKIVSSISRSNATDLEISNCGGGEAINLTIAGPTPNTKFGKVAILPVGKNARGIFDLVEMEVLPAKCTFISRMGSKWTVDLRFRDSALIEENVEVERPYEISIM